MALGHVLVTRHTGPFGAVWEDYALEGGPEYLVEYRHLDHPDGQRLEVGPFRFIVLEFRLDYLAYVVVLDGPHGRLRYVLHRLTRRLEGGYRRALLVAYVLGLSDYHPGRVPSWRDVRVLGRTADWCAWAAENCGSVDPWPVAS